MANFVDTQVLPYLTSFKNYVKQLPVDEMREVGQYKQNQYNEGITKIQGYIDNIAGLDVVKPIHREYLQSKLNELGSNLKKVAGGDFSNFQLVNSIGGMTNQIVKDPTIQNAVISTARYRKGAQEMEDAIKNGKSSPSNEWDFQNNFNKWISDKDVKTPFTGSYQPYTNYKQNALNVIKSLTKDETITDNAFTTDKNGNLVISDAIVRKKLAGISPEKIQTALLAGLTPGDFKQMSIDGRYNYSNASPEQLDKVIRSSYGDKLDFYQGQRKILENAKSSTTSSLEVDNLNKQIASLDNTIKGIKSDYSDMATRLSSGDLDGIRAQLHTSNFLNNFSKAFSFTETSNTYESSPLAVGARWKAEQDRDWLKFTMNYAQKERELGLKAEDTALKRKEVEGYGGLPFPVDQSKLPKITVGNIVDKINTDQHLIDAKKHQLIDPLGKDDEWLNQQYSKWQENPNSVKPGLKKYFSQTERVKRLIDANKALLLNTRKEVGQEMGIGDPDEYIRRIIPKNAPHLALSSGGAQYNYTPEELVDFNEVLPNYISTATIGGGVGGRGYVFYDVNKAQKDLSPKMFELLKARMNDNPNVLSAARFYQENVNGPNRETMAQINNKINSKLNERLQSSQGVLYGIPSASPEQKTSLANMLSRFSDFAKTHKDALADSNFDSDVADKLATDPSTVYKIQVADRTEFQEPTYQVIASGKIGKDVATTSFYINQEQKNAVFGRAFEQNPKVAAVTPYLEQLRKMGGFSTAFTKGDSNHENSYLKNVDFPNVSVYGVTGNIENYDGGYSIALSIYDPITKEWKENISFPKTGLISKEALYDALNGLTDTSIYDLINEKHPNTQDLNAVKKAANKPL